jgi:hypothetical protein
LNWRDLAPRAKRALRTGRDEWGSRENQRNIVITGPGRSGTTLTCHLLNKLPETVALSEPIAPGRFADRLPDHEAVCDGIEEYYLDMRRMALREGVVISKHVGGVVPDNHLTNGEVEGVRRRVAQKGRIGVGKDLRPGFYLAIKQPRMFTALLPTLAKRFPCFAVVRNPLAIRASSLSIESKKARGKNPHAIARYDEGFRRYIHEGKVESRDKLDRWLLKTHYIFERYRRELPRNHIIRYEDIVGSGGKALEVIVPAARELDEPLRSRNLNPLYDRDDILPYAERLLESEGAYWDFYSRNDVEELLEGLARA